MKFKSGFSLEAFCVWPSRTHGSHLLRRSHIFTFLLLLLNGGASAFGVTQIGTEAVVPFNDSYNWNAGINFQPGNGEVVNLNPPRFGWCYATNMPWANRPEVIYEFQLQISTNSDFHDFLINVRTPFNFYNYLPSLPTGAPIFWKVGYINYDSNTTNFWSAVRSFTVDPAAAPWDRSLLASQDYLDSKSKHPYVLFNDSNKAALASFLTNAYARRNDTTLTNWVRAAGKQWGVMKGYADVTATNAWVTNYVSTNSLIPFGQRAQLLANLAFVWQMTADAYYTNANPMEQLYWTAQNFIDRGLWKQDPNTTQDTYKLEDIAYAYDMFFPILTDLQRDTVKRAISLYCNYTYHGAWKNGTWRQPKDPTAWETAAVNGLDYTGGYYCMQYSPQHIGTSHWHDQHYLALRAAFAAFNDDRWARLSFDFGVNYLINRGTPYGDVAGVNQGRLYGMGGLGSVIGAFIRAQTIFPEIDFSKSPVLQSNSIFWDYMVPVGFKPGNEAWGDAGFAGTHNATWSRNDWGRNLACVSGNGVAWQHWLSCVGASITADSSAQQDGYSTSHNITTPYFLPPPAPQTNTLGAALFAADGWAFATSQTPTTIAGYTNGVGIIFQARPRGSEQGHSHNSDLSFQIWAYGANVTDAGGAYNSAICKIPDAHYSLLVNGIGPVQGNFEHNEPWAAKMIGFANTADAVYMAAEAVNAYPRKPNVTGGSDFVSEPYRTVQLRAPTLSSVNSVQRHIVMPRKKYFVMLDNLVSLQPSVFSWKYNILEPTLNLDSANARFAYTVTNQYNGSNVTVYVAHVAAPSSLSVTNMQGTNVYVNPITGSNYFGGAFMRANTLWFSNARPTTRWHFMTVVYPVKWGETPPEITRLDDYTVRVRKDSDDDIVSFDPDNQFNATLVVDFPAISGQQLVRRVRPGTITKVAPQ